MAATTVAAARVHTFKAAQVAAAGAPGRALLAAPRACVRACPTWRVPQAAPSPTTPVLATSWAAPLQAGARPGMWPSPALPTPRRARTACRARTLGGWRAPTPAPRARRAGTRPTLARLRPHCATRAPRAPTPRWPRVPVCAPRAPLACTATWPPRPLLCFAPPVQLALTPPCQLPAPRWCAPPALRAHTRAWPVPWPALRALRAFTTHSPLAPLRVQPVPYAPWWVRPSRS